MKTALACAFLFIAAACDSTTGTFDLPDWSEGFPGGADGGPGGGGDGGGPFMGEGTFGVRVVVDYDTRLSRIGGSPGSDCVADAGEGELRTTRCQIEAKELDLYFHGFGYAVEVAPGTCDYLGIMHYMYQAWEAGLGPSLVSYQVDENGELIADGTGSQGGEPYCAFDHSATDPNAPNCCFGTYQVQVTVVPEVGEPYDLPLSPAKAWGGTKIGACYAGAAYSSSVTELEMLSGLPKRVVVELNREAGTRFDVTFESPLDREEDSNVTLANYLEPGDDVPVGNEGLFAVEDYNVECLDTAEEVLGRIRFVLREWDEEAEFESDGDPNSGKKPTPESPPPLEENGSGSPINDYYDWSDFVFDGNEYVHFSD